MTRKNRKQVQCRYCGRWGILLEGFGRESVGWDIEPVWSPVSSKERERAPTLFDPWLGGIPTASGLPLRSDRWWLDDYCRPVVVTVRSDLTPNTRIPRGTQNPNLCSFYLPTNEIIPRHRTNGVKPTFGGLVARLSSFGMPAVPERRGQRQHW